MNVLNIKIGSTNGLHKLLVFTQNTKASLAILSETHIRSNLYPNQISMLTRIFVAYRLILKYTRCLNNTNSTKFLSRSAGTWRSFKSSSHRLLYFRGTSNERFKMFSISILGHKSVFFFSLPGWHTRVTTLPYPMYAWNLKIIESALAKKVL